MSVSSGSCSSGLRTLIGVVQWMKSLDSMRPNERCRFLGLWFMRTYATYLSLSCTATLKVSKTPGKTVLGCFVQWMPSGEKAIFNPPPSSMVL